MVAIGLDDARAAGEVLHDLVLDDPVAGLAHGPLGVLPGLGGPGPGGGRDDAVDAVLVVAREGERRPLRLLQHRTRPRHAGGLGQKVDDDLVHVPTFPLRLTSCQALPIATSTRPSNSSESSGVMRMPGLYCSTLGSRVEKIAQTPLS